MAKFTITLNVEETTRVDHARQATVRRFRAATTLPNGEKKVFAIDRFGGIDRFNNEMRSALVSELFSKVGVEALHSEPIERVTYDNDPEFAKGGVVPAGAPVICDHNSEVVLPRSTPGGKPLPGIRMTNRAARYAEEAVKGHAEGWPRPLEAEMEMPAPKTWQETVFGQRIEQRFDCNVPQINGRDYMSVVMDDQFEDFAWLPTAGIPLEVRVRAEEMQEGRNTEMQRGRDYMNQKDTDPSMEPLALAERATGRVEMPDGTVRIYA